MADLRTVAESLVKEARYLAMTTGPDLTAVTVDEWLALLAQSEVARLLAPTQPEAPE